MAKITGLIGSGHGKLGNTVMTVRRGQQIARVYQPVVANPKSARQQLSRAKMRLAVATLRPFLFALQAGWNKTNPGYEFQKAVGIAIPMSNGIIDGAGDALEVTPAELRFCISAPILEPIAADTPDFSTASVVNFRVFATESAFSDDVGNPIAVGAVVAVWNPAANAVVTKMQVITYSAQGSPVSVTVPARWSGMPVHVYAFVKQIPAGINGISTETLPWRFPAKTSAAVYVGEGEIA